VKYFKNTELAKLYNVSEKSVRNWIEAAQTGKLDLQLHEEKGKFFVANISKNTKLIEALVTKGKKYRNTRGHKTIKPTNEFYELYAPRQISDIITNIDIYREIPYQYNYFGTGAEHWDRYAQRLVSENIPSNLTSTIHLLEKNASYLDEVLQGYKRVNVIDVGVGNALPAIPLLTRLHKQGILGRYIAVDISQDMLDIAEKNVRAQFGDQIRFESHMLDMMYDRFDDLLTADSFGDEGPFTINLVLLFGGTIYNLREPGRALQTINDSMGVNDLLLSDEKLDSASSRRYFDFSSLSAGQANTFRGKAMLDQLNIHESFYTLEQFFDPTIMARQARIRLNVALSIEFEIEDKKRTLDLNKDETILLWRSWHQDVPQTLELFDNNNFDLLLATRSLNQEFLFTVSKIKTRRNA
jgi:uncharacterized SAM-dependent methyltransferase